MVERAPQNALVGLEADLEGVRLPLDIAQIEAHNIVAVLVAIGTIVALPLVLSAIGLSAVTDAIIRYGRWPLLVVLTLLMYVYAAGRPGRVEAPARAAVAVSVGEDGAVLPRRVLRAVSGSRAGAGSRGCGCEP